MSKDWLRKMEIKSKDLEIRFRTYIEKGIREKAEALAKAEESGRLPKWMYRQHAFTREAFVDKLRGLLDRALGMSLRELHTDVKAVQQLLLSAKGNLLKIQAERYKIEEQASLLNSKMQESANMLAMALDVLTRELGENLIKTENRISRLENRHVV